MKPAQLFALLRLLCLAVLMAGALPAQAQSTCQSRVFNGHEDRVSAAYIAYYGRPADTGGLAYWAGKLAAEGGKLDAIIDAFGNSAEYRQRFGGLSNRELIRNLYQQLYGRDPDAGGWAFYEMWLDTKVLSLASIAISIMDGTEGDDVAILNNRKSVARHFITRMESLGAAAPQITDGDLLANLMAAINASAASRENACAQVNALIDAQASAIPALTMSAHEAGASGAISNLSGAADSGRYFKLTVPAGVTNLVIRTFHAAGGMGDVDLYVSRIVRPVPGIADCSSTTWFSADEQCSFATPVAGEYFILLRGQIVDYSGVTLSASWRGRGNVNVIETSVDLRDVTLPAGEYALLANNNELPLSPYGGTHTLGLDPAVPNLLAVSNEFNNPVLLGRTQPGQTQADISLASTAEMLVVARLGFAGIEVSNQTLLGQRIRQHALFADLLAAIKTAISRGSPCPLKPECNLLAAQIVEEMVDSLNLSGLLVQGNPASMALAAQNNTESAATALNGRMSFSLDSKGEATVSNSYLTYYLARAKNMQTGAFTDWKLVEPASKRLTVGSDISKEDWDYWLPSSLDFITPKFEYKKTSFDLSHLSYGSGASWKNSGLVIQGASIRDLVADGYNKKLSKEEDAVAVISLLALNTIQLFDITASTMKVVANDEIIKDSAKAKAIFDGFKKYAGWLSSSKEFSDTFKDYIALTVATLDFIENIVDVNGISEDEDAFGWNVMVTARKSKDILDVLSKAVGVPGGIGALTDKEREKNIREAFEDSLRKTLDGAASSGTEALVKAARKEFAEKYKKNKMKAWILLVQPINEGIEIYLKKLEKDKKDLEKAGQPTEKIEKRIFYFKYGREAAYFMALVGGGLLNPNDFEEMTQPHVFVPMLYKIGKSVLGELFSEKNIHSMIYNLASGSGTTAREQVQKYADWKKKSLGRIITGLKVGEATGNRLIPFLWDAAFAENRFDLSVVDGQLSVLGMPKSRVRIAVHRAGSIIKTYDFRSTDTSQSGTVAAQPGDKLTYSVFLEQPELFDINRAPWHLNRAVAPQVVYDVSVNVPNQLYHGMALCVRKWPTLIMNLDFSAQYRQGTNFVPENGQCGAGTLLGGNWYESIDGKSLVYKEDKLPPALRLETGGGAVLTGDYVVKSGDKALSVQVFPFRSGNIQHQIALNQTIQASLSVQESGDGFVTLAWSKVPSASGYEIFVSTASSIDPHNPSTYTYRVNSSVPSAKITGLKNGTLYYFGVTAIVGAEATDLSNVVSATPQAQAVASIKLRATPGDGYVDLSWDAVPGATQYDVFQGLSFAGSGESALTWLVATGATSGRVSGLENGVRYGFSISARANKVIVARSGMVSATPQGATTPNLIAGRYLPIEGGSVIRDTVNNLEWQRCSVGQTWNGAAQRCDGTAAEYNWNQATQLTAAGGFRIPTIEELKTLMHCSSGTPKQFGPLDGSWGCSGSYSKPTIVQAAFPNTPSWSVWSGSPNANVSYYSSGVNFGTGGAFDIGDRSSIRHVRLVRGGQSFTSLSARLVTPVPVNAASTWAPASPVAPALANLKGYEGTPLNAALNSVRPDASGRGAYFLSRATNLVPGANNGAHHLFHFDAATGQIKNLGASTSGTPGDGDITAFDVALQAGKLVFRTKATNLESGPGLYLLDLETGTRRPLLTALQHGGSDPGADNPVLGTTGQGLAFDAPDAAGRLQVFTAGLGESGLHDLRQETPIDGQSIEACCAALSGDGRYLAWQEVGHDGRVLARVLDLASDKSVTIDWPKEAATGQVLRLALSENGALLHWLAMPDTVENAAPLHGVANPLFVPTQRLH